MNGEALTDSNEENKEEEDWKNGEELLDCYIQ